MSSFIKPENIAEEAARRQAELRARFQVDKKRERQAVLAGGTLGKKVHDIIPFPDSNGDDVVLFVYIDNRKPDFDNGETVTVMIVLGSLV